MRLSTVHSQIHHSYLAVGWVSFSRLVHQSLAAVGVARVSSRALQEHYIVVRVMKAIDIHRQNRNQNYCLMAVKQVFVVHLVLSKEAHGSCLEVGSCRMDSLVPLIAQNDLCTAALALEVSQNHCRTVY